MIEEHFQLFSNWIFLHRHWAEFTVFMIAMAESLAVVGLVIPGVAMMFAVGALIGTGILPFVPICLWATAGAITGDGLSFWIGRYFHMELQQLWPFRSHPWMIDRGIRFFHRYGGRSVLFGRFFGPVRGITPLVAGMLDMPTVRFLAIGVFSAILWAPAYLLPGMVFGASLELASKVAGRLVFLILLLVILLWLAAWLSKKIYWFLLPRTYRLIHFLFDWNKNHPLIARLTNPILDPNQRDYVSLIIFGAIIYGISLWLCAITPNQSSLQFLRTPWADSLLLSISALGSYPATTILFLLIAGQLTWLQRYTALSHLLIGFAFCVIAVETIRLSPIDVVLDGYVLRTVLIFGFVAVLLAGSITSKWAWLIYSAVSLTSVTVMFARIYLGAASAAVATITLASAFAWTAIVGIAYRRHRKTVPSFSSLSWIAAFFVFGFITIQYSDYNAKQTTLLAPPKAISSALWWNSGWKSLRDRQENAFNHQSQPSNLQWSAPLEKIRTILYAQEWKKPSALNFQNALQWLNPEADIAQVPILPKFFQGRLEALVLIKPETDSTARLLRLWPSDWVIGETGRNLWIGRVSQLQQTKTTGFLNLAEEIPLAEQQLDQFVSALKTVTEWDSHSSQKVLNNPPLVLITEELPTK